jgi:hypothetical protein
MQAVWRAPLVALATAACLATTATATATQTTRTAPEPTASCRDAVLRVSPEAARSDRWRVVLGTVSLPAAYIPGVVAARRDGWNYWSKAGISIEAGSPAVRISVPKAWRGRVAIHWGLGGPVSAQRIAPCSPPPTYWAGYSGGFRLKQRSACVPLLIQVGDRSATIRFGIGRRCP